MHSVIGRSSSLATSCFAIFLAGCTALPTSGPDEDAIFQKASARVTPEKTGENAPSLIDYAVVDVSRDIIPFVNKPGVTETFTTFGGGRGGAPEILVGVGDTLQVTIFESSEGGLFIPADAGSRPGNFVNLPRQTVDRRGYITVPYAGQILASGRSLPQIQTDIEARLANRAVEPQALVSFVDRRASEAAVLGEVNAPNKFAISENGDRVLDIISRAGGLSNPGYESYVTLTRAGRTSTVYFNRIVENPSENIFVAPGDTVYVYQERRFFQAFGASGLNGSFEFDQQDVTLAQAVGQSGGLLDSRADPGMVFVYRLEDRRKLLDMGVDLTDFSATDHQIPTIYRMNFRDPSGFFLAQKFFVESNDILYISNADSVELIKFLTVLNSVTSTVSGVSTDARLTRNNAVSLSKGVNVNLDE
jgi:polysaccharide export outer membrane protein